MIIRVLLQLLVYSNLWIGIGAAGMAWMSASMMGVCVQAEVYLFVLASTILTYTFQRSVKLWNQDRVSGERMSWMQQNRKLVGLITILSFGTSVYCLFFLNYLQLISLIVPAIISFFYAWKLPFGTSVNLRDIPGIKIFLIAGVWTYMITIFPLIGSELSQDAGMWRILLANFLFILGLTIPFDVRDLGVDDDKKRTIPQVLGERLSVYLAVLLIFCSFLLLIMLSGDWNAGLFIAGSFTLIFVGAIKGDSPDMSYSFILDGMLVLTPVLYWVFSASRVYSL